ncbi:hypothetical protein CARUB_v10021634mg, partial [Capsella rubella]
SSLSEIRNLRLVSKPFQRICNDPNILQSLSLHEIPLFPCYENKRNRGLKHIAKAADKGNQEAQYIYGLILICLGGETKEKGFKVLSSLRKPLMSNDMWWCGEPMMRHLKRSYVRENCSCDGRTDMFFVKNCGRDRYGEDNDMTTSSACEICLWHHEVQLFFDKIEK